jgi:NAD(P)-dependent dehydrogenase (short-subunit alcohol dehydrogenase family)
MTGITRPAAGASSAQKLFDVRDRVVVITGASAGIGAAAANCFAANGAIVVAAARRLERLQELQASSDAIHPFRCDVSDDESCRALIGFAVQQFGRIDVLVNNAGDYVVEPAESESPETFRRIVDTNLTSTFVLSQAAAQHMLVAGRGAIVNVASIFGLAGNDRFPQTSYAASKGGVVNLTRELAAQWGSRGVRVNAIAPAFFNTEMTADLFANDRLVAWVKRRTPLGRPGEPEELLGPLLFLASDASTYVTGVTLPVDGGWTAL